MRKIKRIFALLLAVSTLFVILSATASAKEKTWETDLREVTHDITGNGWKWDADTKTMTMEGFALLDKDLSVGVYLPADSTLILAEGSRNLINLDRSEQVPVIGIGCDGDLTVKGSGKLTISSPTSAFWILGSLNIDNCTIIAQSDEGPGFYGDSGVTVKGSTVEANCYTGFFSGNGSIIIQNSSINADCSSIGILSANNVGITNSTVYANGSTAGIVAGETEGSGRLTVISSDVTAIGGVHGISAGEKAAIENSRASIFATSFMGIVSSSGVNIKNSEIYVRGGAAAIATEGTIVLEKATADKGLTALPKDTLQGVATCVFVDSENNVVTEMNIIAEDASVLPKKSAAKAENPFTDVSKSNYYYDAVLWALENDITTGTTATTFGPDATCTRGQAVTFLWRAMGSPEPTSTNNPFTDVNSTDYFYKPVLWAVEQGITNGTSAATFSPHDTVTRGHTLTFLWRAVGKPEYEGMDKADPADAAQYYYHPVMWALSSRIAYVDGESKFVISADCPRAEIVFYIFRALK